MSDQFSKALIYCRVSDTKQKHEGSGLESQEYRCRQYAMDKQYLVEQVFQDDVSGGGDFAKRPGMIALLDYLERHPKTNYVVIFDDLKRLARDTIFHWKLRYQLSGYGASVECLNYQFGDSPEAEFMETIFAAQGQLERKQIGRQTRQKTQARLEAGYYAFIAPVGYLYKKTKTQGKMLFIDPAVGSILREVMEGFASGRFQTKEEARYFLEAMPEFPKTASGKIGNSRIDKMLSNPLYAGYIEYRPWGITLREGQHEGIISFETFQKIQQRLKGRVHAPARKDLNKDFPLRGAVACECGNAFTSCWSKSKTGRHYPYYVCQNRKCHYKGKSIRKEVLEGEFETLLKNLSPTANLVEAASAMFKALWQHREGSQHTRQQRLQREGQKITKKIEQLLDKVVEADSPLVVSACEKKIKELENNKRVIDEKVSQCGRPIKPYEQMYRTSMAFLQNPHKLWAYGGFEDKRAVLKLALCGHIIYDRGQGYRTPDLSLPFKMLEEFCGQNPSMVPRARLELAHSYEY